MGKALDAHATELKSLADATSLALKQEEDTLGKIAADLDKLGSASAADKRAAVQSLRDGKHFFFAFLSFSSVLL